MLCARALGHLHLLYPVGARQSVRLMLTAMIEQCAVSRTLLGRPVVGVLGLAQALVDAADAEDAGSAARVTVHGGEG